MYDTMRNGKYFPNNWRQYKDSPDEMFIPHAFDDIMEWKVYGWQLMPKVSAVMRVQDLETSKVKEYSYQRLNAIQNRCQKLKDSGKRYEITVATHEVVDVFLTHPEDDQLFD